MKLDVRALAWSTGLVFLVLYAVCGCFVMLAPAATAAFFGTVNHLDMSGLARTMTWGTFFAGAVFWFVLPAMTAAAIASAYNASVRRHAVSISFAEERAATRAQR